LVKLELLHKLLHKPEEYIDDVQDYLTQEGLHTHPTQDLRCSGTDVSTYTRAYQETQ